MKKVIGKHFLWTLLFSLVAVFMMGGKAQAATPTIYTFEDMYQTSVQSYSEMDVTSDKVADTVKIQFTAGEEYSRTLKIYINDKQVFTQKRVPDPTWNVQLIRLKNGKVFFDISSTIVSDDACIHRLYAYKSGKLKKVYDFQKYYAKYATYYTVRVTGVSGNKLKTKVSSMFYLTGAISYDMNLAYKGGKFKRTANQYKVKYTYTTNSWTAGRTIKVYKKAGSKKLAFTLEKGDKVKINKVIYKNNKPYIQVKQREGAGKTGYIPCVKKYADPQYFEEAMFAG
ncbi:MAG: hypothetical protein IJP29_05750 [Lachnospiraceae bacterium]|nr:hypothetical protein [Lachnospiraceae bacterium]